MITSLTCVSQNINIVLTPKCCLPLHSAGFSSPVCPAPPFRVCNTVPVKLILINILISHHNPTFLHRACTISSKACYHLPKLTFSLCSFLCILLPFSIYVLQGHQQMEQVWSNLCVPLLFGAEPLDCCAMPCHARSALVY